MTRIGRVCANPIRVIRVTVNWPNDVIQQITNCTNFDELKTLIKDINDIRRDKSNYTELTFFKKIIDERLTKSLDDYLFDRIIELLPEGPAWFPKDQLTDKTERFIVSEIVREKIFKNYQKEIPYSCEVVVEEFKEEETIIRIKVVIIVERQSQKGIIIGHKGASIKKVGTQARIDIESFFEKKVFIEFFVKVKKDWRDNDKSLRDFGYV